MARILKILVLQSFIIAVIGKSVKLQFEFEDILKLLPYLGSPENLKNIVSTLSRSANVRAELPANNRYNNPYHPEDDNPYNLFGNPDADITKDEVLNSPRQSLDADTQTLPKDNVIKNYLLKDKNAKAHVNKNDDLNIEKDNDNFVKEKQVISEDELTDFVNDVNSIASSVQKLTKTEDTFNLEKEKVDNSSKQNNINKDSDDRSGFQFLQKRFVLKSSDLSSASKGVEVITLRPQDLNTSDNASNINLDVSTRNYLVSTEKAEQDKKYNDHVAKRDLGANIREEVPVPGEKYVGFVVKPDVKKSFDLDDPLEKDIENADRLAIEAIEKSPLKFAFSSDSKREKIPEEAKKLNI